MTKDPTRAPQPTSQCVHGHAACVQAWLPDDPDPRPWSCYGFHLIFWDDGWEATATDSSSIAWLVEHLILLLIEHGVDHTTCTFKGRGLEHMSRG